MSMLTCTFESELSADAETGTNNAVTIPIAAKKALIFLSIFHLSSSDIMTAAVVSTIAHSTVSVS